MTGVDPKPKAKVEGIEPAVAPLVSGLLLGASFRWPGLSWLAWVAFFPLAVVIRTETRRAELYAGAFIGGTAFHFLALDFLRTDSSGMMKSVWVIASYGLAPFIVFAVWGARSLTRSWGLPQSVALPAAWVVMEFLRRRSVGALIGFDFPFLEVGTTQIERTALVQIADLFGVPGVTWLVIACSGALGDAFSTSRPSGHGLLRQLAVPAGLGVFPVLAAYGYGLWRLAESDGRPGPTVALASASLLNRPRQEVVDLILAEAERASGMPDLVVGPEGQCGQVAVLAAPSSQALAGDHGGDPALSRFSDIARDLGAGLLIGGVRAPPDGRKYNSFFYLKRDGSYAGAYDKHHLVPGLEFQPSLLRGIIPWTTMNVRSSVTAASRMNDPGTGFPVFRLRPRGGGESFLFACSLCSDLYFPGLYSAYFEQARLGRAPEFFAHGGDESYYQGLTRESWTNMRFRAIESRRPFARQSDEGYSAIVDGSGRVVGGVIGPGEARDVLIGTVPLDGRNSVYVAGGKAFPLVLTVAFGLSLLRPVGLWLRGLSVGR